MERSPHAELTRATAIQLERAIDPTARENENYRKLVARAVDVFGDEIKASRWLSIPNSDLNGATPLEATRKEGYSAHLLEPIINRIEHWIDYLPLLTRREIDDPNAWDAALGLRPGK